MQIHLNIKALTHKSLMVFVGFFTLMSHGHAEENQFTSRHVQTLAASCAACHGSEGNSLGGHAVLAGLDASHFVLQMMAFKNGTQSATVMHRHAKGLTVEEINDLALYFSQQKRIDGLKPPNQKWAE